MASEEKKTTTMKTTRSKAQQEAVTPYAPRLLKTSKLLLLSVGASAYFGHLVLLALVSALLLSSHLYWSRPFRGALRNADMALAFSNLAAHLVVCGVSPVLHLAEKCFYYLLALLVLLCYWQARSTRDKHISSLWHAGGLHLLANLGNVWLYALLAR